MCGEKNVEQKHRAEMPNGNAEQQLEQQRGATTLCIIAEQQR